jgi:putrescine:ornithine antiporter
MRTPFARGQRGAHRIVVATWMALFAWSAAIGCGRPESGQDNTAGRVRKSGTVRFGYRVDARPFSYRDAAGKPAGYSIDLCQGVADAMKAQWAMPNLKIEWVPVTLDGRFTAIEQHQIDLLCGAESATLERRKQVDFSIPFFPGGVGVAIRKDASAPLKDVLSGTVATKPAARGVALVVLRAQTFGAVEGTTAQQWLSQPHDELKVESKIVNAPNYTAGLKAVVARQSSGFFGDRAILLDAVLHDSTFHDLGVVDRLFTLEPVALALPRGDDDLRLLVDQALGQRYHSADFWPEYIKWFGKPDASDMLFFGWTGLPN